MPCGAGTSTTGASNKSQTDAIATSLSRYLIKKVSLATKEMVANSQARFKVKDIFKCQVETGNKYRVGQQSLGLAWQEMRQIVSK